MTKTVIAVDVGGTTVDVVCISEDGQAIGRTIAGSSPSGGTKDEIVAGFARAIEVAKQQADGYEIVACGIGMPGPFDYESGVSHMIHKFQAINGVNLGELLSLRIGLPVYFINDAGAFGLGVNWQQLPDTGRLVALTIGTGLGGSFIENGKNVEEDDRIPLGGEVWDLEYEDGILEDKVSARGIVSRYDELSHKKLTAKQIADLARDGDEKALATYKDMGTALGRGLAPVFAHFQPEKIVVGGKIGQSLSLFQPAMEVALTDTGLRVPPILRAAEGNLALWGAAKHAFSKLH